MDGACLVVGTVAGEGSFGVVRARGWRWVLAEIDTGGVFSGSWQYGIQAKDVKTFLKDMFQFWDAGRQSKTEGSRLTTIAQRNS